MHINLSGWARVSNPAYGIPERASLADVRSLEQTLCTDITCDRLFRDVSNRDWALIAMATELTLQWLIIVDEYGRVNLDMLESVGLASPIFLVRNVRINRCPFLRPDMSGSLLPPEAVRLRIRWLTVIMDKEE